MTNLSGVNLNNGSAVGPQGEGRDSPSSFLKYPAYKDSGVEWLGEVPEHWDLHKLKYIARFSGGGTPNRENLAYWNGDIPWVSPKDMKVEVIVGAEENITAEGLQNSTTSLVSPGGILIVVRSGILKHTIPVAINNVEVALNQDMKALRFNPEVALFDFFLRWVQGFNNQLLHAWLKQGATVESIEQEYLSDTTVPMPGIDEQRVIVDFLDHETARIDALIEEQQRLIELLKEKRQAVISHAVTKGLDPTMPMKDSGAEWLGEVPAHWETLRIGAVYSEAADKGLAELPVLRVSIHHGVSDKELSEEESDRKITRIDDREKYKRVRPGDLVYNMMRAWQGGFGAVLVDGLVSPAYVVARPKNEDISRYVEQLLRTGCAVEEMRKNSYGITDFRLRLYWDQFKNIVIVIPPEVERQQIMERIDSLINESEALKSEADRLIVILQERRSALISAAVTGKIDVRGWQPPARAQSPVLEAEAV